MRFIRSTAYIMICMICAMLFALCACGGSATVMEFSFNTSTAADSRDSKLIHINEDMDKLELDAALKVDSGEVGIQIANMSDDEIIWAQSYNEDSDFIIELKDLKAGHEYSLNINAVQSKQIKLTVKTDAKLVKDKEKPEKYTVG